jgi:outer membrane protein assembly factor BamB
MSSPALSPDGSIVYVGSDDTNVYALNTTNGTKLWNFTTQGQVYSSPSLSTKPAGSLFIGSQDKSLYAIDIAGL